RQRLGEVGGHVFDAVFIGSFLQRHRRAAHHADHLDAVDLQQRVDVFHTEGPCPRENYFHAIHPIQKETKSSFLKKRSKKLLSVFVRPVQPHWVVDQQFL